MTAPLLTRSQLRHLRGRLDRPRWRELLDRWIADHPAHRDGRRMTHGTAACYRAGCRRPECRAAHAAAVRAYRRRTGSDGYRKRGEV